ncbi:MAG: hypothetical protein EXS16_06395 [Gemmataceae bacterium]|nr:hypothetical protein [Gemmataceae bacterium]
MTTTSPRGTIGKIGNTRTPSGGTPCSAPPPIFTRFFRLFGLGKSKRKRPVRYTRLHIEQLESRDCPTSAPGIENLVLNTSTPLTNDIIGPSFTTTDADGDSISYDYVWRVNGNVIRTTTTNLPYDPYQLYYTGYGDKNDVISLSVTPWDANDRGATVTVSAIVANSAPLIDTGWLWAVESFKGDAVSLQINATDDDGDTLTIGPPIGLPPGLNLSSTGLITGTVLPSANTTTPYSVTVTATDGSLSDTTTFIWTITLPTVTLDNPGNQTYDHNVLSGVWLTASNNASHPLTNSIASATPLPDGLAFNATYPDLISGTIPITAVSATPYTVTVIATDIAGGVSASQTFTITVVNQAPTIGNLNFGDPNPKTNDVLNVYVNSPADINGDPLSFTYVWTVDGFVVQTTATTSTTDSLDLSQPGFGDKGQLVEVTVTPSDSLNDGAALMVSTTVAASRPVINSVVLDNYWDNYAGLDDLITVDDVVTAQLDESNPDGDPITYHYVWTVDGLTAKSEITSEVVDTLDLTQLGLASNDSTVGVTVSILIGGVDTGPAFVSAPALSAPAGPVWVSPPFVGPFNRPARPGFVFIAATSYAFTTFQGVPTGTLVGTVQTFNTSENPTAYSIVGGNANNWLQIDANGNITVKPDAGLPLTSTTFFVITVAAADSANPGLPANQRLTSIPITLRPTVVITGDFQGAAAPIGGGTDNINLKFVRLTHDLSAQLTVPYTVNWNGFDMDNGLVDPSLIANTGGGLAK